MSRVLLFAATSLVLLSSCHFFHKRVRGSGNVIQLSRNVSNFNRVSISSAMDLYLKQDSGFSVKVETDDNLQQYVIVRQENGVLHISQESNINLDVTGKIRVFVSAPVF